MSKGVCPLSLKKFGLLDKKKDFINVDSKLTRRSKKRKQQQSGTLQEIYSKKMKLNENSFKTKDEDDELSKKKEKAKKVSKGSEAIILETTSGLWIVTNTSDTLLKSLNSTMNGSTKSTITICSSQNNFKELKEVKSNTTSNKFLYDSTLFKNDRLNYFNSRNKFKKEKTLKMVTNPYTNKTSLPKSRKKVNINLKLNKSQEIYEHHAQIKSSPGIPFDANKKPRKSLLKNKISSPINPFYRKNI